MWVGLCGNSCLWCGYPGLAHATPWSEQMLVTVMGLATRMLKTIRLRMLPEAEAG